MTDIQKSQAIEQFPAADLHGLREEIRKSSVDGWQSAELISNFLSGRGYGVSTADARTAASRFEALGCSLQSMQEELEKLALVM